MAFGDRLLEILESKEISQKDFAITLNIAPTTLNGYIKNKRQPDFETIKSMAFILGVSIDYLFDFPTNGISFSIDELSMVEKMRKMSINQKQILVDLANSILKNSNE